MGNCNSGCDSADGALMNRVGFLNDEFGIIQKLPKYGLPSDQSVREKRVQFQFTPSDRRETDDDGQETQEETPEKDLKESGA